MVERDRVDSWSFFGPGDKVRCWCNKRLIDLGKSLHVAMRPSTGQPLREGCAEMKCRGCNMLIEIRFSTGQQAA